MSRSIAVPVGRAFEIKYSAIRVCRRAERSDFQKCDRF
jgi:hypothetical protein